MNQVQIFSDGGKRYDGIDSDLKNSTEVLSKNIQIQTLWKNIDVADIQVWNVLLEGKCSLNYSVSIM